MEVIEYLNQIRGTVKKHIGKLKSKEEKYTNKKLAKPFEDISNKINIAIPLTTQVLKTQFTSSETTNLISIRKQILKTIYRDFLFIATMSSIEYHFAKILLQFPKYNTAKEIRKNGVRKVALKELVDWSYDERLLSNFDLWDFARCARNDIVHQNAIARHTKPSPITDFPIDMNQGQGLSGNLRSLLSLTKAVEDSFFQMVLKLK